MTFAATLKETLRKDLQLEWRSKDAINSMLFFALLTVVIGVSTLALGIGAASLVSSARSGVAAGITAAVFTTLAFLAIRIQPLAVPFQDFVAIPKRRIFARRQFERKGLCLGWL